MVSGAIGSASPAIAARAKTVTLRPAVTAGATNSFTDGRYVAWTAAGDLSTIFTRDTRTATERQLTAPSGCEFVVAAARRALFSCTAPGALSPTSLITTDFAGADPLLAATFPPGTVTAKALYRYWIAAVSGQNKTSQIFINWRTGERRPFSITADPDTPDLKPRKPNADGSISGRSSSSSPLTFRHLGHRTTLSRCRSGCSFIQQAFGRVVWVEKNTVHIYRTSRRTTTLAKLPAPGPTIPPSYRSIVFTPYELAVDLPADNTPVGPAKPWIHYTARLPRR